MLSLSDHQTKSIDSAWKAKKKKTKYNYKFCPTIYSDSPSPSSSPNSSFSPSNPPALCSLQASPCPYPLGPSHLLPSSSPRWFLPPVNPAWPAPSCCGQWPPWSPRVGGPRPAWLGLADSMAQPPRSCHGLFDLLGACGLGHHLLHLFPLLSFSLAFFLTASSASLLTSCSAAYFISQSRHCCDCSLNLEIWTWIELVSFPSNLGEATCIQSMLLPEDMVRNQRCCMREFVGLPSLKASLIYALTNFQTQTMVAHNQCGIRIAALWAWP